MTRGPTIGLCFNPWPRKSLAKDAVIAWADADESLYWKTEENKESYTGKIVTLCQVCFFEVKTTFNAVSPGTYDVVWRLKVHPEHEGLTNLKFTAEVIEQVKKAPSGFKGYNKLETYDTNEDLFKYLASKYRWVDLALPFKVTIPEERMIGDESTWYDVEVKIFDHSGNWKKGLSLDNVCLRPY
ncbi:13648_t:CDS:2 [Ambispora leptoticha]|uniref:13648_t:CDS:1 n=1 Tax=Ambispora leptoticha TaxID=144679 RepID=A0A9N9G1M7_9GLOM|nr:13648_t:CDS:2 [Ambispora leptoticha]